MSVSATPRTLEPDVGEEPAAPSLVSRRMIAMVAYAVALGTFFLLVGLPTESLLIFAWLLLASVCWNIEKPFRSHVRWLSDWCPLLGLMVAYDVSRGFAKYGQAPHITEMITFDKSLFGGTLPTTWLQDQLYDPKHLHWWDVFASVVYMSHFVATLTCAVVLYLRSRDIWARYMRRWLFVTGAGLATYFLYPAAPPWWASRFGYITDHVERMSGRGWSAIGLSDASDMLDAGIARSNPTAAMPSLHSGWAMLLIAFFLPMVAKKWWPLLFAYPLSMTFTLVYTGDHYIADVLLAWVYVALAFIVVGAAERSWRRMRARQAHERLAARAPVSPAAEAQREPHPEPVTSRALTAGAVGHK